MKKLFELLFRRRQVFFIRGSAQVVLASGKKVTKECGSVVEVNRRIRGSDQGREMLDKYRRHTAEIFNRDRGSDCPEVGEADIRIKSVSKIS